MVGYATACGNGQIPGLSEPHYQRPDAFGAAYDPAGEVKGYNPLKAAINKARDAVGDAYRKASIAGRDYLDTFKENFMPKQPAYCYNCKP